MVAEHKTRLEKWATSKPESIKIFHRERRSVLTKLCNPKYLRTWHSIFTTPLYIRAIENDDRALAVVVLCEQRISK